LPLNPTPHFLQSVKKQAKTLAAESIRKRFLKQIRNSLQITTLDAAQTTEFVNLQKSFAHRLA
jgi:hypothetical protein